MSPRGLEIGALERRIVRIGEGVDADDVEALGEQPFHEVRADESGGTGHQGDRHGGLRRRRRHREGRLSRHLAFEHAASLRILRMQAHPATQVVLRLLHLARIVQHRIRGDVG